MLNFTWNKQGIRRYIGPKRVILLLGFIFLVFWAREYYYTGSFNLSFIEHYRNENPIASIMLFILIYIILVIVSLPTLPLNLAAGFFWGGLLGGVCSALSVTIGGWFSFIMTRCLIGQPLTEKFDRKWVSSVQKEFHHKGWRFVAFARLNPIIPTGPLNYILALTSLSNKTFLWATFIFLLPPAIAVSYLGDSLEALTEQESIDAVIKGILVFSAAISFLAGIKFATRFIKNDEKSNNES